MAGGGTEEQTEISKSEDLSPYRPRKIRLDKLTSLCSFELTTIHCRLYDLRHHSKTAIIYKFHNSNNSRWTPMARNL